MSLHRCEHDIPLNLNCELCRYGHVSEGPDHTRICKIFRQNPEAWDVYWKRRMDGINTWTLLNTTQRDQWRSMNEYQILERLAMVGTPNAYCEHDIPLSIGCKACAKAHLLLQGLPALDTQIGGDHYKHFKIQPVEFIHANGIPFIEGNIIKYACRWRDKGGKETLEKIKHYVDLLIELEHPADKSTPATTIRAEEQK